MGKTIRRKDLKGDGGYYEWRNEVRNHPKASENYVHGDMPSRRGRWAKTFEVKEEGNTGRRAEARILKGRVKREDAMEVDTNSRELKHAYSDPWNWD